MIKDYHLLKRSAQISASLLRIPTRVIRECAGKEENDSPNLDLGKIIVKSYHYKEFHCTFGIHLKFYSKCFGRDNIATKTTK